MKITYSFFILIINVYSTSYLYGQNTKNLLSRYEKLDTIIDNLVENQPEKCIILMKEQSELATQIGNDSLIYEAAINKAQVLNQLGIFDQTIKILYDQLSIFDKKNNESIKSSIYYDLGASYFQLSDHKKAIDCFKKSKKSAILSKKYQDTVKINTEIGLELVALGSINEGISLSLKNLQMAKKQGDEEIICISLDNLSNCYNEMGDYKNALKYQLELYNYQDFINKSLHTKSAYNQHLAEINIELKNYDAAQKYVTEATKYATKLGSKDWLFDCYRNQSEILEATGDYKKALQFHQKFVAAKDSVYKKDYDTKMSAMANLYDLENKQNQIDKLIFFKQFASVKIERLYLLILILMLIVGFFAAYLHYKKVNAEKELQQKISHRLLQTQEDERQRISRELHDSVGQNILFLKNQLYAENIDRSKLLKSTDVALEELRIISKNLYPNQLEKYGLIAAVDALAVEVNTTTGIFVSCDMEGIDTILDKNVKINFYRIIQEFVNNTLKHADASAIRITAYRVQDKIELIVQDNGKGFDKNELEKKSNRSFGLLNMEERVKILKGKITIESQAGKGTISTFTIPI